MLLTKCIDFQLSTPLLTYIYESVNTKLCLPNVFYLIGRQDMAEGRKKSQLGIERSKTCI